MQAPVLHAGMPPMTPAQGLMPHMAAHVPILPRMPSGHLGLARGAAFSPEEIAIAKKTGREEERGVNDGADVLLRAAKKARSEVQPPLRREEPPFHVAIPARAPRGAYEPEEVARESGYIGVRWSRKKGKWRVRIKANGKVRPRATLLLFFSQRRYVLAAPSCTRSAPRAVSFARLGPAFAVSSAALPAWFSAVRTTSRAGAADSLVRRTTTSASSPTRWRRQCTTTTPRSASSP
eukprot:3594866-Rhodomonas_salina.4